MKNRIRLENSFRCFLFVFVFFLLENVKGVRLVNVEVSLVRSVV